MAAASLQQALGYLQSGNTTVDGIKEILQDNPQICKHIYGKDGSGLSGDGFYLSIAIQVALTLLLGTLQSCFSYITPPHASSSTRLLIARLQVVHDTTCSGSVFLYLMTMVTIFIRLRQDPGAFECVAMQRALDITGVLLTLAIIAHITQQQPLKIKTPPRRWSLGSIWTLATLAPLGSNHLKSKSGKTSSAIAGRLCAVLGTEPQGCNGSPSTYPSVSTPPSNKYFIFIGIGVFFGTIFVLVAIDTFRNWFWTGLKKFFSARATHITFVLSWLLLSLTGVGLNIWQLLDLRQKMLSAGATSEWDLGQVLAVALWIPALYQLLLTSFVCLDLQEVPNEENFSFRKALRNLLVFSIGALYKWNVGEVPKIEEESEPEASSSQKPAPSTPELEKADRSPVEKPPVRSEEVTTEYPRGKAESVTTLKDVSEVVEEKSLLVKDDKD